MTDQTPPFVPQTWAHLGRVDAAVNSDLVGDALYEAFPSAYTIPADEWEAKLQASWARLAEYDRLTAERKGRND